MSNFVRPAAWLRQLYTQSRTEHVHPTRVSDDVSLVGAYDGGGWGFVVPAQWIQTATSLVGVATTTTILSVPADHIVRILAASARLLAGAVPTYCTLSLEDPNAAIGVDISPHLVTVSAQQHSFELRCPILGPTHDLIGRVEGGDASTQMLFRIYSCTLPLGVSPTI